MTMSMHRRTWLIGTAAAITLPSWPLHAATDVSSDAVAGRSVRYGHQYTDGAGVAPAAPAFTAAEAAIIAQLVDAILPADSGSPSAVSLGTPDYVQSGLALGGADTVNAAKQGFAAIDGIAQQAWGMGFAQLNATQRDAVVNIVVQTAALVPLWLGVRSLAVLHYYAQPAAYTDLGLPGPSIDAGGFPQPNTVPCAA